MEKNKTNYAAIMKPNSNRLRDEIYELTKTHPRNNEEILELRAYPRAFSKFMDSNDGALFLSQLIYWTDRPKKSRDGFFYKSVREWCDELDITEYQVEKFRGFLSDKGILEMEKRRIRKNFKEQWHYRLNQERLKEVYHNFLDNEFLFPNEDDYFDYEEITVDMTDESNEAEITEKEEMDEHFQDSVSLFQDNVTRNQDADSLFEDIYSCFQENNNNVLDNKLINELNIELNNSTQNSRNTKPSANFSQTVTENINDTAVIFRNTEGASLSDARRALEAFRSVGANCFDVTLLNDSNKQVYRFKRNVDLDVKLEDGIAWCEENNYSFIVRPHGANLIQVDDCNEKTLKKFLPYCFFAEETSENNYQVWLALPDGTSKEEQKQIRNRLLKKLINESGNGGAFGATRWVGSINFKPKHNRFRVRLISNNDGRFTSAEELENVGLLGEAEKPNVFQTNSKSFKGTFPDYNLCLHDKEYDRSDADASFLAICKSRGFSREESLEKLLEVSERTQESPPSYRIRTLDFVFGKKD